MSVLIKRTINLSFSLLLLVAGCKKDADFPVEIRPSDFWVQCTVDDAQEQAQPYYYRGEDTFTIDTFAGIPYSREITYTSTYGIDADRAKWINGSIVDSWGFTLFNLNLRHPDLVTDPLRPPEWTKAELEAVLVPGASIPLGDGPGQASMAIRYIDEDVFYYTLPNNTGSVLITEVEDYGSPDANIAYFGKKVHVVFEGAFYNAQELRQVTGGEAVLFFRYFNY
jgi:hypothetical protein